MERLGKKHLRVAGYQRIAEADPSQVFSVALIDKRFSDIVGAYENWSYLGTFIDEGETQKELARLISDCVEGKIELIISGSACRFANTPTQMNQVIEKLKALDPPVGVYFVSEGVYSLDEKAYQNLLRIEGCEPDGSKT